MFRTQQIQTNPQYRTAALCEWYVIRILPLRERTASWAHDAETALRPGNSPEEFIKHGQHGFPNVVPFSFGFKGLELLLCPDDCESNSIGNSHLASVSE
jgi:hypothetical protein